MADASAKLLSLNDLDLPGRFVVKKDVPVFCEHTDPETGEKVGTKELEELAKINNERMQGQDAPGTIVIGHTPGVPEKDILTVGFKKNYHVGTFGKDNKVGLLVDCYFKPDLFEKAKQYPHRSIELWTDDKVIEPLSLISRRPQLDLGLTVFAKTAGKKRIYAMSDGTEPDTFSKKTPTKCPECGHCYEHDPDTYGAMPSGTGTHMAELITYSKEQYEAKAGEAAKLKADLEAATIQRQKAEKERDDALKLYSRQARTQAFEKLKAEGVSLDVVEELKDTETLDDAGFEKHIAKAKKCYARASKPALGFIPVDESPEGGDETPEQKDAKLYAKSRDRVMTYAMKHGCKPSEAWEMIKAGKV